MIRRMDMAAFCLATGLCLIACSDKGAPTRTEDDPARIPFDTSTAGLPDAVPTPILEVRDGDTLRLTVEYVAKRIAGRKVRMLAYNRSVPGPTIKAPQGARITLLLSNLTSLPATLHSHGLRLDYRFDGMPGITQPADSGATVEYNISFPDPGIYWYHPHYREDYQLELGLYGSYLVAPRDSAYWPPVHREVVLMLDDILLGDGSAQPFYRGVSDHALMGRFGNVLLVNGDDAFTLHARRNEVIRFYAVNASTARVYNLQFSRDMDLNVIGADNGRMEFPTAREDHIVAPSERLIFQIWFNDALDNYDTLELLNATPLGASVLGRIVYDQDTAKPDLRSSITLARSPGAAASFEPFRAHLDRLPDEEILLTGAMDMSGPLLKKAHDPDPSNRMGVEWNDSVHGPAMVGMNRSSNDWNTNWVIRDLRTGRENHAIKWKFRKGDKVMIRVRNDTTAMDPGARLMFHPMPHPIHFHGQRFLVVRENGRTPLSGLAWRDTYLIGRGYTVDLLLDADNPGEWMFHCHIAEHLQSRMLGHFSVAEDTGGGTVPLPWSLSIAFEQAFDSLRSDTTLSVAAQGGVSGKVNGFDASRLEPTLYLRNAADPARSVAAALDADGRFAFAAAGLLGASAGRIPVAVHVKSITAGIRPSPDTLRLTLDRRPVLAWTLDIDLAGEAVLKGLRGDTAAVSSMRGEVAGRVGNYDPALARDTLYFRNRIYPEYFVHAPLGGDGSFRFDATDLVGSLDGLHSIDIRLESKSPLWRVAPDTLRLDLSIP